MILYLKEKIAPSLDKLHQKINNKALFSGFVIIASYFLFEMELIGIRVGPYEQGPIAIRAMAIVSAIAIYYLSHLHGQIKNNTPKKELYIELVFFIAIITVSLIIGLGYNNILKAILPNLQKTTTQSELIVFLIIAPIMEEVVFRKLLYDNWAFDKFGRLKAMLVVGLLFVLTHPIVSFGGFILYWLPTLLFFMVYDLAGIKASIGVHFIYNLVALI